MRGGRVSPHHLLPRPPRRALGLHHADRGGAGGSAGSPRQRQPDRGRRRRRHGPALRGLARPLSETRLPVRGRRRAARQGRQELHDGERPRRRDRGLRGARQGGSRCLRARRARAVDALGRARLRPRIRPRGVQRRRGFRLQHGRHGEQGPQHLQRQIRARLPRNGDRHRLRQHRSDHRARVFPQLDRQPHHLPRLVPALPQGGPDGLPRPGVLVGRTLAAGAPHRRGALLEGTAILRGCRPPRPSGAADAIPRDQQLLHGDGLREGRRDRAHAEDADRRDGFPPRHGPLFRALRRNGRDGRGFPGRLRRCDGARPVALRPLVCAIGNAAGLGEGRV